MTLYRRVRRLLSKSKFKLWCCLFKPKTLRDETGAWYSAPKPVLWAYAGGGRLHKYGNSKEAIDDSIAHGLKVLELDVALTSDGVPVLSHQFNPGGSADEYGKTPTLAEFKSAPLDGCYTPLTLKEFFEAYDGFDGYVSLDPHAMSDEWVSRELPEYIMANASTVMRGRVIYQIFGLDTATKLARRADGFASLHLSGWTAIDSADNLWRIPYMTRVMSACGIRSVSIGDNEITESTCSFIKGMRDAGIHVSVAGVDTVDRAKEWISVGVDVFNTRLLTPADFGL